MKLKLALLALLSLCALWSHSQNQGVSINGSGNPPAPSAMLDVQSTSKGVLFPRLTTAERDAISDPAEGLIIYNTDCLVLNIYVGSAWEAILSTGSNFVSAPVAGPATNITKVKFTAHWGNVIGATTYLLEVSTVNDFSTHVSGFNGLDVGDVTSFEVTGLECETAYFYRVRAANECGGQYSNVVSVNTISCITPVSGCVAIGGPDNEVANDHIATSDGGTITVGQTYSFGQGSADVYVVKLNNENALQWTATIGGADWDVGYSIIETSDNGYAIAGITASFGAGQYDIYVIKLDSSGNLVWTLTVGESGYENGYDIIECSAGGYLVAGSTNSFGGGGYDLYAVKLSSSGTIDWTRSVGGSGMDEARAVVETSGGYVFAGMTNSFGAGAMDAYIVKLDVNGTGLWTKTIGGPGSDQVTGIMAVSGGDFVLAGQTGSYGAGSDDAYVFKIDSSGNLIWTAVIGGVEYDRTSAIMESSGGEYVAVGLAYSFGAGDSDVYLVRLNSSGSLLGATTIGGTGAEDFAYGIDETAGGDFVIGGATYSAGAGDVDFYSVHTDNTGEACCTLSSGGTLTTGGEEGSGGGYANGGTTGSGGTAGSGGVWNAQCN